MNQHLMNTYNRLPVTFTHGEGVWLWDSNGQRYLDALAGIAVTGLGHAHPAVTAAVCEQAGTLVHTSNLYQIDQQRHAGAQLCRHTGMERVFFANSGAEANEAAIKLARLYGYQRGISEPQIVVTDGAFHGRTLATVSATANTKAQAGFAPLLPGFVRVPYNAVDAIAKLTDKASIAAILVEPIQGEGGIVIPAPTYLERLRELCDQHGWLLLLDEVQTGVGRTGRWLAYQHSKLQPDVVTLAKGLGNGVPIGACLARGAAAEVFAPGSHGSTFGGNPLACAAARAVMDTIDADQLCERAAQQGQRLLDGLRRHLGDRAGVIDIRGQGLMVAIELDRPCAPLVGHALEKGVLINVTADRVVRLLPPLILQAAETDLIVERVTEIVTAFLAV